MEKLLENLGRLRVSFSSSYFGIHWKINSLLTIVMGLWMTYYQSSHNELVCHKNSGKEVLTEHCWSSLYFLQPTKGKGAVIDVNTWMLLYPFLVGQLVLLIIPFLLWFSYDRHYLVQPSHEFKNDPEKLVDFFLKTVRANGRYILIFHVLEMLNMVLVTVAILIKIYVFKLGPMGFLSIIMNKEPSILDSIFPENGICTETRNSHIPDLPDIRHYKCLLHLNWQRSYIFYGNSWWLVILWCGGVLQLLKTLAVVMLKPLRVFRLEQQGGKLRSKLKLCHIANQMDYADYMVALGLGSRMTTSTFNEFVVALYNRLVPVPDVDGDLEDNQQDQETIQLNQFDNTEDGHLASVQQCDD